MMANPDPENRYLAATFLAACGQKDAALRLLKSAIDGKYCAHQALQKDPMLATLRSGSEYTQLLSAAEAMPGQLPGGEGAARALSRNQRRPPALRALRQT